VPRIGPPFDYSRTGQRKLQDANQEILKALGNRLREAREHRKLAQSHVAKKIGKSVATLSQIESGKSPGMGLLTVINIIRVLEVDPLPLLCNIGLLLEWQGKRSRMEKEPGAESAVSALNELYANVLQAK